MFLPTFHGEQMLSYLSNTLNLHGQAFTQAQREELQARIEELVNYQAVVGIMGKTGGGQVQPVQCPVRSGDCRSG